MGRGALIGRERELDLLVELARGTADGRGAIVFLSGPTGSGKSDLIAALAETLAAGDGEGPELVSALCYETSAGNPLGPFGEVLRALTSGERRGDRAKRVLELVGQVAPPLVELIPVIGKLAALGVKAASDVGIYALGGSHEAQQAQLASDVAAALRRIAGEMPLVLVVDDAHWIDAPSTEVIARLSLSAQEQPLVLVVAYDPALVDDGHPLARVRATAISRPGVRDLVLADLGLDAVASLLRERYGTEPGERFAEWLHDRTDGSPLFLDQFLATLEEQRILRRGENGWGLDGAVDGRPGDWRLSGALAEAHTPGSLLELLRPRVADLDDEERSLLESGAVQGRRFLSTVIVRLLDREEDEILDRLAQLADRRRMIAFEEAEDWWSDRSALYSFDPSLLQELLYGRYARSPYERRRRHAAVATALEALIAGDDPPPRHALLEIARHYAEAGEPLKAAARLVEVAESTFAEGADRETASHAERAVALIREAPLDRLDGDARIDAQRLLARAILFVLLVRERGWDPDEAEGAERMLALAAEAERAAEAVGDPKLTANVRYGTAVVRTAYRGLEEGIATYREALALARAADDSLATFAILVDFGHHLDSVDLREGWTILQEAHGLLTGGALDGHLDDGRRGVEAARLETTIGVAAFDLGRYGEALECLVRSAEALREARRTDDAAWSLAFLTQLYTAIGLYEAAEATAREAIGLFADSAEPLGVRGYVRGLLGHLYLEWEPPRPVEAREVLAAGRDETTASASRPLIPLVEWYWAELLLAEGGATALRAADEVLAAVDPFGWARSEIATASLRARIALAEGRLDDAADLSARAVAELAARGGAVPAVRSEEILFAHARILAARGSADAAASFAEAARVVREKADSLDDPAHREAFRTRVRLTREILASAPG